MSREQILLVAALMGSVGTLAVGDSTTWAEVIQPRIFFPAMAAIGAGVRAVYTEKP